MLGSYRPTLLLEEANHICCLDAKSCVIGIFSPLSSTYTILDLVIPSSLLEFFPGFATGCWLWVLHSIPVHNFHPCFRSACVYHPKHCFNEKQRVLEAIMDSILLGNSGFNRRINELNLKYGSPASFTIHRFMYLNIQHCWVIC